MPLAAEPAWPAGAERFVHWRAAGVSVVLALDPVGGLLPQVVHWGADLGDLGEDDLAGLARAAVPSVGEHPTDVVRRLTPLPEHARGWVGRPGLEGSRAGRDWSPVLRLREQDVSTAGDGTTRLTARAEDPVARLAVRLDLELAPSGLLRTRAQVTNTAEAAYRLDALRLVLPVPPEAVELLDFSGRHTLERVPQRTPFAAGLHSREVRTGRTGLDAVHLLCAGTPGFSSRTGEVWAVHLGWSGNQAHYAERLHNGSRVLGAGELLLAGEVELAPGAAYTSPWLYAAHGEGLDAVAGRVHAWLRARPIHPARPRPVTLNTWEAVYFDHDVERLTALAEVAAGLGIERFVLDDGWFGSRRDDTAGLGDWRVSADAWPDGLHPLVDRVHALGMEFGLWVEPEMVNLDSELARAHPEWLFSAGGRVGDPARNQHVLDLAHPGAYEHVRGHLQALLDEYAIAYLKWDHNRYLVDAGHTPGGEPGVHAQTRATYRLLDELRAANPGLEIESCASGGGRVDLGILQRTDRVWASDTNDALERQGIQRWTQLLLPPELIGTHVGPPRSHTTGRTHDLSFRAGTALWGHMGVEWDLTTASAEDLEQLAGWIGLHKQLRPLLHGGTVVTGDHPDPQVQVHGVVAPDRGDALFALVAVGRSVTWPPAPARLPGLDPDRRYRVRLQPPGTDTGGGWPGLPPWCA
ncbi:MAG TPA: alpha-galactosidase, partial [Geodermatophilus sp.]|nr:alpha-galactosidase [Geodermatophilus sp.]